MQKRAVVIISSIISIITIITTFSGCISKKQKYQYQEYFKEIINDYDKEYKDRDKDLEEGDILRSYKLNNDEKLFIVQAKGYEEDLLLSVQMDNENIIKVNVLYENESEDYGEYVTSDWFLERFEMKIPSEIKLVKRKKTNENEVIAITGATNTSQAVVDVVNKCISKKEDKNE